MHTPRQFPWLCAYIRHPIPDRHSHSQHYTIIVKRIHLPPRTFFRYANEELRVTASSIAAAAVAEEPGMGRGRVAELGACMADLIASDFEALDMAGLRYSRGSDIREYLVRGGGAPM